MSVPPINGVSPASLSPVGGPGKSPSVTNPIKPAGSIGTGSAGGTSGAEKLILTPTLQMQTTATGQLLMQMVMVNQWKQV